MADNNQNSPLSDADLWYSESEIRYRDIPRPVPLIPDLLYVGTAAILAAGPKVGKSFLAQQWEHYLAFGRPFGNWPARDPLNCLIIDLEGDPGITQDRSRIISPLGSLPHEDPDGAGRAPNRIHYAHQWYTAHHSFAERVALLDDYLTVERQQGRAVGYVRIDTMRLFIGKNKRQENVYDFDAVNMAVLNRLAARHQTSIVLLHHLKKDGGESDWVERLSGSMGSTASASVIMYLDRARGAESGILHVASRRGMSGEHAMAYDTFSGLWEFAPELTIAQASKSGVPRLILDYLQDHVAASSAQIQADIPAQPETIKSALCRLRGEDLIDYTEKMWTLSRNRRNYAPAKPAELFPADQGAPEPEIGQRRTASDSVGQAPDLSTRETQDANCKPSEREYSGEAQLAAGNPALVKLCEVTSDSRLRAVWKVRDEIKSQMPYERVCLGGAPSRWQLMAKLAPAGRVLALDRKSAFIHSAKTWLVPNVLRRVGAMDYDTIRGDKLAGMLAVPAPAWNHLTLPNPMGTMVRPGEIVLIPRAVLDRLAQLAEAGLLQMPPIIWGLVGKGSENMLVPWAQWALAQRAGAPDEQERGKIKEAQSSAIGSLRIVDPDKSSPFDRPDWQYAIHGHHHMTMHRAAMAALDAGDELIAMGNTDELVFHVPHDAGDDWIPPSMRKHVEGKRFDVKYMMDAVEWYANPRRLNEHGHLQG